MKKYISIALMSLSVFGITSCDMDAPSQSSLDASVVFSQYDLAEGSVMAIHDGWGKTNSYRGRWISLYGMNTDAEWWNTPSYNKRNDQKQNACNYNTPEDDGWLDKTNDTWQGLYEGIEKANIAIDNIREYGNVENNPDMAQLLGEALTLRALIYVELVKTYGDVPARFEQTTSENAYMHRTNKDEIYKQILADLEEAENYCYWPNESSITKSTERVSKTFVKGLRARAALYAGGYSLYSDGTYRLSDDEELAQSKMHAIALKECQEIIQKGCNTLGTFEENFKSLCQEDYTAGKESIWEIPFSEGRGRVVSSKGTRHESPYNQWVNYQKTGSSGAESGPVPTLFYDYDVEDIRRDITCIPYKWSNGGDGNDGDAKQELWGIKNWSFGKLRYEWMKRKATSLDDGINWQIMRYADIYMMAAEAENELNGPSAAWQYLKPVLDRALPAAKVSALQSKYTASKDAFRKGIQDQRKFEFAGEMLRKQDLIRWGILDETLAETKSKLQQLANRQGDYADLPEKLYFTYESDGITLKIYGLNHGDTDDEGKELKDNENYDTKGWFISNGENNITEDIINGLYVVDKPSQRSVWPIIKSVIDNSAGYLNNDFLK